MRNEAVTYVFSLRRRRAKFYTLDHEDLEKGLNPNYRN